LSETEVVVGRDVQGLSRFSSEGEIGEEVGRSSVEDDCGTSCDGGDGSRETIFDTEFESSSVEGIEIGEEWCVALWKNFRMSSRSFV